MDFLTWTLLIVSVALAVALLVACLLQVLWLGRTLIARLHRPHPHSLAGSRAAH